MAEILATIAEHVREVVERRRRELPVDGVARAAAIPSPTRGFAESLSR